MSKGNKIMGNRKFTSDAVGSALDIMMAGTLDGGDSMPGFRDRKGGDIMTNARATSNQVGGEDIIGRCGADPTVQRRVNAAVSMDARIERALRPTYASAYRAASMANDSADMSELSNVLLRQMVADEGVAAMVKDIAAVDKEFGGLGLFQRAVARRLEERRRALATIKKLDL